MAKTLHRDSDGNSVNRTLLGTAVDQLVTDGIWAGILHESGNSGEVRAWTVDDGIYQWYVPDALTVNDGDIVYLTLATHTAGVPQDAAYTTSAGAGKIALFKSIGAKVTANGAGDHYCFGKSLLHMQGG